MPERKPGDEKNRLRLTELVSRLREEDRISAEVERESFQLLRNPGKMRLITSTHELAIKPKISEIPGVLKSG